MASSHAKPPHTACLTLQEHALFCYLKLHPDVAATYSITKCSLDCMGCQKRKACAGVNGKTSIGCMLMQTLEAQGMHIAWHEQLPNDALGKRGNESGAAYIKKVDRRPGAWLKQLSDRPAVAPPPNSQTGQVGAPA